MNPEPTPARLRATRPLPNGARRLAVAACATAYVLVLAGANLLTSTLGMMTAGFGLTVTAGVVFGADNGCDSKGCPGDQQWLTWLAQWCPHANICLWRPHPMWSATPMPPPVPFPAIPAVHP